MIRRPSSAVFVLLLALSSPAWAGYIRGQVRYNDGEFAKYVIVRLRSEMIAYESEARTDDQGKFNFDGLPLSTYHLIIEGQGFRRYERTFDISMSKMAYELITLKRDKEPEARAIPPAGPQDKISAVDAAAPENARNEFSKGQDFLLHQNKPEDAVKHLRKATEIYDGYAQAYSMLGLAYLQLGMPKEAHLALERAIKLDPSSASAHLTYGMLLNAEKDFAGAQKALERGVELQPDAPEGQFELAKAYFAQGEWQAAEPHAQKAVALQANLAPAHILLGNIALKKQDAPGALKEFREYLRIDPKGPFAPGVAQMIQKLEQAPKN